MRMRRGTKKKKEEEQERKENETEHKRRKIKRWRRKVRNLQTVETQLSLVSSLQHIYSNYWLHCAFVPFARTMTDCT